MGAPKPPYNQFNNNAGGGNFKPDYQKPFNKFNNNQDDKKPLGDGGFKKFDYNNKFNNPMQNGYIPGGQQAAAGGYQGGYQKNFTPNQDGFKPRNAFVKPDFNGNPRSANPQFAGDKPPFQNKYMGNKPRAPFNGGPTRFNGEFGGPQKFNKFDNYKGGYGQGGAEGGEGEEFQGGNQYNSQPGRHYNNSSGNNRFDQQQGGDQQAPAAHGQQPFVQAEPIDGAQFGENIIPGGYRMAIPKMYDANAGQMQFQQAYGE
jgi:hypothetical protein